jgi:hypothetical protein
MQISNIYQSLKEAVRFYPNVSEPCKAPQTFAVLANVSDLSTPNLGKTICDKNKPYFFSRLWENKKYNPSDLSFQWPAIVVYEENMDLSGVFSNEQKLCYNVTISVLDTFDKDCDKLRCTGCKGRTPNEVFQDTENILFDVLKYLQDLVITTDDTLVHRSALDGTVAEGKTTHFQKALKANNSANTTAQRFVGGTAGNLYGNSIRLKFCFDRCNTGVEWNFEASGKGEINDVSCCG